MAIIKIPQPSLWDTIPSGVDVSGDIMFLEDLVVIDSFDDATLDPTLWDTDIVAGAGTASIIEAGGEVAVKTAVNATAGAILDYKTILNPRASNRWRLRTVIQGTAIQNNGAVVAAMLWQGAANPNVGAAAAIQSTALFQADILAVNLGSNLRIRYFDVAGNSYYWDGTDWTLIGSNSYLLIADEIFGFELENDGTNLIIRVYDSAFSEVRMYASIDWASIRAEANNTYLLFGDPFNDAWYGEVNLQSFEHRGDYPTGQVAITGEIPFSGGEIEQYPVVTDGTVIGEYSIDGGAWVQPGGGSDAEMAAALIGLFPATLNLRYTMNSDGLIQSSIDINGGVLGCPPSLTAVYETDEMIIVEDEDIIIIEGCE